MTVFSPVIKILHPSNAGPQAQALQAKLSERYETLQATVLDFVEINPADLSHITAADLLLILFDDQGFPDRVVSVIDSFRKKYGDLAWILPIALDKDHWNPPQPLSGVNAGAFFGPTEDELAAIARRTGALLGLWLRGGERKIFISFRAVDADAIAKQLQQHLSQLGFRAWQDKAPDEYDQPQIDIGEDVQQAIEQHVATSNLVLLLDTPRMLESSWVREEINLSVRGFVPLLPIVFRDEQDFDRGPRHRGLLDLRRWVNVSWQPDSEGAGNPLNADELDRIVQNMERYLMELAGYELQVPKKAKQYFSNAGYEWQTLDSVQRMYAAEKGDRWKIRMLSHCSLYSPTFCESLNAFRKYELPEQEKRNFNHRLFVYGTALLDDFVQTELEHEIGVDESGEIDILHLSELHEYLARR